jgi:transcriptional regulator with XRE-family HTH domain
MTKTTEIIKAEMRAAHTTVEELAEYAGISAKRLEDILGGTKKPSISEGIAIAKFFEFDPLLIIGRHYDN